MRRGKAAAAVAKPDEKEATGQQATQPGQPPAPYENAIKPIATVSTVEEFWNVYDYLTRPSDLPTTTDYHFFRAHIKPTWEDKSNEKGGKWIVRLPKGRPTSVRKCALCLLCAILLCHCTVRR